MVSHLLLMVEYPDIMVHSIIDKARRDRYRMLKGFYHGERLGFLGKKSQSSAIIHAVNLPEGAFVCGKKIAELLLPMGYQYSGYSSRQPRDISSSKIRTWCCSMAIS